MRGLVFTSLEDMVCTQHGLELWDSVVESLDLPSGGSYTSAGSYEFDELEALMQKISEKTNQPVPEFIENFGIYMFPVLYRNFQSIVIQHSTLKKFFYTVDSIIHVEVRKLYPNAALPTIHYEDPAENQLVILYNSPRKLCFFAKGLMKGAALHYGETIEIVEPCCMHRGSNHCRLEVKFGAQ